MPSSARSHGSAPHWKWYVLIGVATFGIQLWLCRPLIADYFPTTDEIAVEAASTPIGGPVNPAAWFTQGFQDYFRPYEEWGSRPSNFFRPLFNGLFWAYYQAFGTHWAYQLIVGYFSHALIVGLIAYLALDVLALSTPFAVLAILIAALNPACWSLYPDSFAIPTLVQFPAYQTEIICAGLSLAAFLAFIRSRLVLFALFATSALLLKETALSMPVAALLLIGAWRGPQRAASWRNALWLALPLIVWLVIKLTIFQHGFSSFVMASDKPLAWLTQPLRNTLLWPTGLYSAPFGKSLAALRMHAWGQVATYAFELSINLLWWVALAIAVAKVLPTYARWRPFPAPPPWVCALVFAGGNLALLIALQETHLRYGYLWFALGPAPVFRALSSRREGLALAAIMSFGLLLPQLASVRNTLSADSLGDYHKIKRAARQLTSLLGTLPPSVKAVYLIDDAVVQVPSPSYMAKFSGFGGRLVLVNSVRPVAHCTAVADTTARYRLTRRSEETLLQYSAPACFERYFGLPPLGLIGPDHSVRRGNSMIYHFPELSSRPRSTIEEYDTGQEWSVSFNDPMCRTPGACVWIGLDERRGEYFELSAAPSPALPVSAPP